MSEDAFNMSMRKFLKQVGVTSQRAIEDAVRSGIAPGSKTITVKMVLTSDNADLNHEVTGEIELP